MPIPQRADRKLLHGAARAIVELDLVSPGTLAAFDRRLWNEARRNLLGLLATHGFEFVEPPDMMGRYLSTKIQKKPCPPPKKRRARSA